MRTNGVLDHDCYAAYGNDNGYAANFATSIACTSDAQCAGTHTPRCDVYGTRTCITTGDFASTAYASTANYNDPSQFWAKNSASGCSDSWKGDGTCDLCLVAKYGYDAAPGQENNDDCANMAQYATPPSCTTVNTLCKKNSDCGSG
jgi:hypothetical protein